MKLRRKVIKSISMILIVVMVFTLTDISLNGNHVYAEETEDCYITVEFINSIGNGVLGGQVSYLINGTWEDAGTTDSSGYLRIPIASHPECMTVRMKYDGNIKDIYQDIHVNPNFYFQTVRTLVSLKDSNGNAIQGGVVTYSGSSWENLGITDIEGKVSKELLPGNYTFRMEHAGLTEDKVQNIENNADVSFIAPDPNTKKGFGSTYSDTTNQIKLNFSQVEESGNTFIKVLNEMPANIDFKLETALNYYDISTTALFQGPVTIEVDYTLKNFTGDAQKIRLYQIKDGKPVDITLDAPNNPDTEGGTIKGTATDMLGIFAVGIPVDTEAPSTPTNLTASAITDTTVDLAWDISTDNTGVSGYKIFRDNFEVGTSLEPRYTDTVLYPGKTYSYKVVAFDNHGNVSNESNSINVKLLDAIIVVSPPDAPTLSTPSGITISTMVSKVTVSWDKVEGATSYVINVDGAQIENITSTQYIHNGLMPNSTHSYRVMAKNENGVSGWSTLVNAITPSYTSVSGIICEDTVWTKEFSPYVIEGSLTVEKGATLQIMPGVVVKGNSEGADLIVTGGLIASGTEEEPTSLTIESLSVPDSGEFNAEFITFSLNSINVQDLGSFKLNDSQLTVNDGIILNSNNDIVLTNNTIITREIGIFRPENNEFWGKIIIDNNKIDMNRSSYSNITMYDRGLGIICIENNQMTNYTGIGVYSCNTDLRIKKNANLQYIELDMYNLKNSIISGVSQNTFSEHENRGGYYNGIILNGHIKENVTFTRDYPYTISSLYIDEGATLNIEPGAVLYSDGYMEIAGKVNAMGIATPIVITTTDDLDKTSCIKVLEGGELNGYNLKIMHQGDLSAEGKISLSNSEVSCDGTSWMAGFDIVIYSSGEFAGDNLKLRNMGNFLCYGKFALGKCELASSSGSMLYDIVSRTDLSSNPFVLSPELQGDSNSIITVKQNLEILMEKGKISQINLKNPSGQLDSVWTDEYNDALWDFIHKYGLDDAYAEANYNKSTLYSWIQDAVDSETEQGTGGDTSGDIQSIKVTKDSFGNIYTLVTKKDGKKLIEAKNTETYTFDAENLKQALVKAMNEDNALDLRYKDLYTYCWMGKHDVDNAIDNGQLKGIQKDSYEYYVQIWASAKIYTDAADLMNKMIEISGLVIGVVSLGLVAYDLAIAALETESVAVGESLVAEVSVADSLYFRGTTEGYAGSTSLLSAGITPASTDPLVSTLFATEAETYGQGTLYIATSSDLAGIEIIEGNVLSSLEAEVGIEMLPQDFASKASIKLTASQARQILTEMGFDVPNIISTKESLANFLRSTPRLTSEQIQQFFEAAKKIIGD